MADSHQTIADVGEFVLIERIKKIIPGAAREDILVGIGDDTAVIRLDNQRILLVTCDIQVEDQHFRLRHITPYQLGRRAMAVNLSDIAAMGGTPTFALVSLGLPGSFSVSAFEELFCGMRDETAAFRTVIVGGNLSRTEEKMVVDITLLGEALLSQVLKRGGAKAGDRIFVTGSLGASGAGFYVLEKFGKNYPSQFTGLVSRHLLPVPRVLAGQKIAQAGIATAMIDLSDGLASDLKHICQMSNTGAEICQEKIPFPEHIREVEKISGKTALHLALHTGEDYELLFTAKPDVPVTVMEEISRESGIPITEIGRIVPAESGFYLVTPENARIPVQPKGWDHFQ